MSLVKSKQRVADHGEVFTPAWMVEAMLNEGLEQKIRNLQKRKDNILTKQVFGIGITQITAMLVRCSVYCGLGKSVSIPGCLT